MSAELLERKKQVEGRISDLLSNIDDTLRQLYTSLLEQDNAANLTEEQQVARLEGFHDYIVVREKTGVEHPSLEDFLTVRSESPTSLLSFGTGRRRIAEDEEVIEDTVSDEELAQWEEENASAEEQDEVTTTAEEIVKDDAGAADDSGAEESNADIREEEVVEEIVEESELEPVEHTSKTKAPVNWKANLSQRPAEVIVGEAGHGKAHDLKKDNDAEVETASAPAASIFSGDEEIVDEDRKSPLSSEDEKVTEGEEGRVPGRIDSNAIIAQDFTDKRGGYDKDQVDELLDGLAEFLNVDHSNDDYEAKVKELEGLKLKSGGFKLGFNKVEVDGFLVAVKSELQNRIVL